MPFLCVGYPCSVTPKFIFSICLSGVDVFYVDDPAVFVHPTGFTVSTETRIIPNVRAARRPRHNHLFGKAQDQQQCTGIIATVFSHIAVVVLETIHAANKPVILN